jgi:hypothetical protein
MPSKHERYDRTQQKLLAEPVDELKLLRWAVPLANHSTPTAVGSGAAAFDVLESTPHGTALDLEASITLPANRAVQFSLQLLGSSSDPAHAQVLLQFNISAPTGPSNSRLVNMSATVPHTKGSTPADNTTLGFVLPDVQCSVYRTTAVCRCSVQPQCARCSVRPQRWWWLDHACCRHRTPTACVKPSIRMFDPITCLSEAVLL